MTELNQVGRSIFVFAARGDSPQTKLAESRPLMGRGAPSQPGQFLSQTQDLDQAGQDDGLPSRLSHLFTIKALVSSGHLMLQVFNRHLLLTRDKSIARYCRNIFGGELQPEQKYRTN